MALRASWTITEGIAIEPLFSVDHEAPWSLSAIFSGVFRLGLSDTAFFYALLYSIAFTLNNGCLTAECLEYKGEALRFLNEKMRCPQKAISDASVGAIIILTGVEVMSARGTLFVSELTPDSSSIA